MDGNSVHYMSKSNEWATPQDLFDRLDDEFKFTVDVAANEQNAKCDRYFTEADNGLAQSWVGERVWCNPPYGREIGQWIKKAAISKAEIAVLLIPARTDTNAWHRWIFGTAEVRFVKGRIRFVNGNKPDNAPFPSAVVIFRKTVTASGVGLCRTHGHGVIADRT
jgi:phage N-6-adenine-methyltransferase